MLTITVKKVADALSTDTKRIKAKEFTDGKTQGNVNQSVRTGRINAGSVDKGADTKHEGGSSTHSYDGVRKGTGGVVPESKNGRTDTEGNSGDNSRISNTSEGIQADSNAGAIKQGKAGEVESVEMLQEASASVSLDAGGMPTGKKKLAQSANANEISGKKGVEKPNSSSTQSQAAPTVEPQEVAAAVSEAAGEASLSPDHSAPDTQAFAEEQVAGMTDSIPVDSGNSVEYNDIDGGYTDGQYSDEFRRIQEESRGMSEEDISAFHSKQREINDEIRGRLSRAFELELQSPRGVWNHSVRSLLNPKTNKTVTLYENVEKPNSSSTQSQAAPTVEPQEVAAAVSEAAGEASLSPDHSAPDTQTFAEEQVAGMTDSIPVDSGNSVEYNDIDGGYTDGQYSEEFRRIQEESRGLLPDGIRLFHSGNKVVDDRVRGRLSRVLGNEIKRSCGLYGNVATPLVNTKTGTQFALYSGVDAALFHDTFEIVRNYLRSGDAVDLYDDSKYENTNNFLIADGLGGFAITKDGDLISVFNLGQRGFLQSIKNTLLSAGAITLDCFNSSMQNLPEVYERAIGFKTASILDFNYDILAEDRGKAYADYFVRTHGEAPVHFMVNTPEDVKPRHFTKDQYDEAVAYQQSFVKQDTENPTEAPAEGAFSRTDGGADIRYSSITPEAVRAIQSIGRKSVNDFTAEDIQKAEPFARRYWAELGVKSPFFRAWFGDWRAKDTTPVGVVTEKGAERGTYRNTDTGWDIQVSGKVFNESQHFGRKNTGAIAYLPYINEIVKKAVLLDSHTVDRAKSNNTLFMHSLYVIADIGNEKELLKLYVEEMNDPNKANTANRAYQLQNIEKAFAVNGGVQGQAPISLANTTNAARTVSDLYALVKRHDKNFNPKPVHPALLNEDGTPKVFYHGTNEVESVEMLQEASASVSLDAGGMPTGKKKLAQSANANEISGKKGVEKPNSSSTQSQAAPTVEPQEVAAAVSEAAGEASLSPDHSAPDTQTFEEEAVAGMTDSIPVDSGNSVEYNDIDGGYTDGQYSDEFRRIQEESEALSDADVQLFHNGSRKVDEGIRGRLSRVFGKELAAECSRLGYGTRVLKNPKTNRDARFYENVSAETFHRIFGIVQRYLPNGDAVDVHGVNSSEWSVGYNDTVNYLSEDGLAGFAITQNGDLISVFSLGNQGFLRTIKGYIYELGVKTLDCYESAKQPLARMYSHTLGFKTASILDFNYDILAEDRGKAYADYFVRTYGEAPVHFMVNTPEDVKPRHFTKDQYDEAVAYQQSFVKQDTENPTEAPAEGAFSRTDGGADIRYSSITPEAVRAIQSIGRKSVNDFTAEDIQKAEPFARRYWAELGVKSPFFRAWFGDWRAKDTTPVGVVTEKGAEHGTYRNTDTGWDIQVSGKVFNETKAHNQAYNVKAQPYLSYVNAIIKKSFLLDSFAVPQHKAKSINSVMMHSMYAITDMGKGSEIIKLYVEELNDVNRDGTIKRAYQLQNIIHQQPSDRVQDMPLAPSALTADVNTVPDLYALVKRHDKNFNPKPVHPALLNEDGTPKVFYHGTNAEFTVFDIMKSGKNYGETSEGIFFFTDKKTAYPDSAADYARESARNDGTEMIYSVHLAIAKPLLLDSKGYYTPVSYFDSHSDEIYMQYLDGDYDGVIIQNSDKGADDSVICMVDSPVQIKSATDNIGTFDGSNADIRYSSITPEAVRAIQSIGRKSVNDFTAEDIQTAEPFARRYWAEMGVKSPFFRAWFGDWRAKDTTPVGVVTEKGAERGTYRNTDTGWDIQVSGKVFNETKSHGSGKVKYAVQYLEYLISIVKNAVLMDTFTMPAGKSKSNNSTMMHSIYAIVNGENGNDLIKLYVEELNDVNSDGTIKRSYQLQNIATAPLASARVQSNTPSSVTSTKDADIRTVSDLYALVKRHDKNFNPKPVHPALLNEDGTPKVFYHGTNAEFTVFDIMKSGKNYGETSEGIFFFTDKKTAYPDSAADYARESARNDGTEMIYSVHLAIAKPLLLDSKGYYTPVSYFDSHSDEIYTQYLNGDYDGVVIQNNDKGADDSVICMVDSPAQIKSAADNIGTFDGSNADIRYSSITPEAVRAIQSIGRKSVNDFTAADIQRAEPFARRYWAELGVKSPFFRAWFGDWRAKDTTPVGVVTEKGAERGTYRNTDTGWDIQVSGKVFNETMMHTAPRNTSAQLYLQYIETIVKKAILIESYSIGKPKSHNSLLMHTMYAMADIGNGMQLLKLYIEETYNPNEIKTLKRAYQLQNIMVQQSSAKGSGTALAQSISTADVNTVSDLYALVKRHDKNFNPKPVHPALLNEDGTPKVFYHGTSDVFTIVKFRKGNQNLFWFTDDKTALEDGAVSARGNSIIMALYVKMDKPAGWSEYDKLGIQQLQDRGYDGALLEDGGRTVGFVMSSPTQIKSATDNIGAFDGSNADIRYSSITPEEAEYDSVKYSMVDSDEELNFLNTQDTLTVYRAMRTVEGTLYPPMAGKLKGSDGKYDWQGRTELNIWYRSDEYPELINERGKFVLNKGNGSNIEAAYNPYFHTSNWVLNDQFSSAYKRPNLVVVEGVIPKSELTSGYRAEKAKDSVDAVDWKAGKVGSQVKGEHARRVYLSRWFRATRIVPDFEVAVMIANTLGDENIVIPYKVVTPSLLVELEKSWNAD